MIKVTHNEETDSATVECGGYRIVIGPDSDPAIGFVLLEDERIQGISPLKPLAEQVITTEGWKAFAAYLAKPEDEGLPAVDNSDPAPTAH